MKRFWPRIVILVAVILLAGWLGRNYLGGLINPLIAFSRTSYLAFARPLETISSVSKLAGENKRLNDENSELQARIARLESVIGSSQELSHQLDALDKVNRERVKSAKVIGSSASPYTQVLRVDIGEESGVSSSQAVLANGHLIGRIKAAYPNWSEVLAITDYSLVLPAKTTKTNQTGIVRGGVNGLILEEVPLEPALEVGEVVTTSGIDGGLPADLPIGTVESVISAAGDVFQRARLSSPVNLSQLRIVLVVVK